MKAMILAAGLGKRMRPLTDHTPKPLLLAGNKPLIVHHIERLQRLGVKQLIINTAYLREKIEQALGDGHQFGVDIVYSPEPEPLETGGALLQAIPLLGSDPFLLVNGDVWTDYPFECLLDYSLPSRCLGRLVLVKNPDHNTRGDFALSGERLINNTDLDVGYTYSGVALVRPELVSTYSERRRTFRLREALDEAIAQDRLQGEVYQGEWWDVGTPERLESLNDFLGVNG